MSAELDARGFKRVCAECGTRFYDFNKRPIICPGCKEEFTGEAKVKARKGRSAIAPDPVKEEIKKKGTAQPAEDDHDDSIEDNDSDDELISLDDLDDDDDHHDDDDEEVVTDPDLDELDSSIDDDLEHDPEDEDLDELQD